MFGRKKKENELKGFNAFDYQEELDVYESIGDEKKRIELEQISIAKTT